MIEKVEHIYEDGKKSLESLIQDKAYSNVQKSLKDKGIDINDVNDADVETLVAVKAQDMMNSMKGFGVGTAFALAISLVTGIWHVQSS